MPEELSTPKKSLKELEREKKNNLIKKQKYDLRKKGARKNSKGEGQNVLSKTNTLFIR